MQPNPIEQNKPGAPHKLLLQLVGDWEMAMTIYEGHTVTIETMGTSQIKSTMEGRLIEQRSRATGPYHMEELNILGYDNHQQKYFSVNFSSSMTGPITLEGDSDEEGDLFQFWGTLPLTDSGKPQVIRTTIDLITEDSWVHTTYQVIEGVEDMKVSEMHYTRE